MGAGAFTEHIDKTPEPVCGGSSQAGEDVSLAGPPSPPLNLPPPPLLPPRASPHPTVHGPPVVPGTAGHTATNRPILVTVPVSRFSHLAVGIYLGFFLCIMDPSVVSPSLHTIALDLKALVAVNWVVLAYILAECACCSVFARVSDHIGRRGALLTAMSIFALASVACGFATTLPRLVCARGVQGIGAGGLFSLTIQVIPEVCPDHLLRHMPAVGTVVILAAYIIGPVFGGLLTQFAGWRCIFWINGSLCVVGVVLVLICWPKKKQMLSMPRKPWKHFDYLGSVLVICGTSMLVFAFQYVGMSIRKDVWDNDWFNVPLIMGFLLCTILVIWEICVDYRICPGVIERIVPVLPVSLFGNSSYAFGTAAALFQGFPLFILMFFVPLRFNMVSGNPPYLSALMLLPLFGSSAVGCLVAGVANYKRQCYFVTNLFGTLVSLTGCSLISSVRGAQDDVKFIGYSSVFGFGLGLSITTATFITASETPYYIFEPAIVMSNAARLLGGSFGVAAFSILVHNEIVAVLPEGITEKDLSELLGNPKSALSSIFNSFMADGLNAAFKKAMTVCVIMATLAVACSLLSFVLMRLSRRRRSRKSQKAAIPIQSV